MYKKTKIIIMLFLSFFLVACKEKREYQAVEITGAELVSNIYKENPENIVFAFYNSEEDNYETYINDIKEVSKKAQIDIYYIDGAHLDTGSYITLTATETINPLVNSYYILLDGTIKSVNKYTDYKEMYSNLKSIGYNSKINLTSNEEKEEKLNKAKELYSEGHIVESLLTLEKAWPLEEAKKFYEENKYFKVINSWERYEFLDKKMENVLYVNIDFSYASSVFYKIEYKSKYDKEFVKPTDLNNYDLLYYYIKDDIIYTSEDEEEKYKKAYEIKYIDDENLYLYEFKNKKEYKYILRS